MSRSAGFVWIDSIASSKLEGQFGSCGVYLGSSGNVGITIRPFRKVPCWIPLETPRSLLPKCWILILSCVGPTCGLSECSLTPWHLGSVHSFTQTRIVSFGPFGLIRRVVVGSYTYQGNVNETSGWMNESCGGILVIRCNIIHTAYHQYNEMTRFIFWSNKIIIVRGTTRVLK